MLEVRGLPAELDAIGVLRIRITEQIVLKGEGKCGRIRGRSRILRADVVTEHKRRKRQQLAPTRWQRSVFSAASFLKATKFLELIARNVSRLRRPSAVLQ